MPLGALGLVRDACQNKDVSSRRNGRGRLASRVEGVASSGKVCMRETVRWQAAELGTRRRTTHRRRPQPRTPTNATSD